MFSEKTTFHLYFWQSQLFYDWRQVKKSRANNKWLHIAMCLLSNRSKITSKCGENKKKKKVTHEPQVSAVWRLLWLHGNIESMRFKQWTEKRQTCVVRLDCSRICASLGISKSPTLRFVSASFFLSYRTCKQPVYSVPPPSEKIGKGDSRLYTG